MGLIKIQGPARLFKDELSLRLKVCQAVLHEFSHFFLVDSLMVY